MQSAGWRMWWRMASREWRGRVRVAGVLDDYVFLGHAALDAWEMTGELRYYNLAEQLMESALERFYDPVGWRVLRYREARGDGAAGWERW